MAVSHVKMHVFLDAEVLFFLSVASLPWFDANALSLDTTPTDPEAS